MLRASIGDAINQHPFVQCPEPKPSRLSLADTQRGGDLSDRKFILEQRGSLLQDGRT
jgi:hypothetical protein